MTPEAQRLKQAAWESTTMYPRDTYAGAWARGFDDCVAALRPYLQSEIDSQAQRIAELEGDEAYEELQNETLSLEARVSQHFGNYMEAKRQNSRLESRIAALTAPLTPDEYMMLSAGSVEQRFNAVIAARLERAEEKQQ